MSHPQLCIITVKIPLIITSDVQTVLNNILAIFGQIQVVVPTAVLGGIQTLI